MVLDIDSLRMSYSVLDAVSVSLEGLAGERMENARACIERALMLISDELLANGIRPEAVEDMLK